MSLKSVQWEPSCSTQTNGRTDRYDEANGRFSQLCARAQQPVTEWARKIMYCCAPNAIDTTVKNYDKRKPEGRK